jgi:MFS family permease
VNHGATLLHLRGAAGMAAIYRKISWRLLPLLMLCCVMAYIDRVNVDHAQRQIQADLGFTTHVFAWGAGAFFVAYALFAVPCNLLLEKLGARKILLRMMLGWGAATAAGAFVRTPMEFYTIRFLLGMCEAGFFPGVILYLTYWYPAARRARVFAVFASATLIGGIVAGPLSDAVLRALHLHSGLQGWQWLLLAQGLPAALLGIAAYFYLDDSPDDARWLSRFEQQMVQQDLARDDALLAAAAGTSAQRQDDDEDEDDEEPSAFAILWSLLRDPAICLLALANLLLGGAGYALVHWAPALLQRWGAAMPAQLGLLVLLPNIAGIVGMIAIGYDSDRRRERRGHFIACMVLAAGGLGLAIAADNGLAWSLAGLTLASLGIASAPPLLVVILTDLLNRQRAAAGIALVAGLGVMGGAFGPALGARVLAWGDSAAMLAALIGMYLAAGLILMLALRMAPRRGGPNARHGLSDKIARN